MKTVGTIKNETSQKPLGNSKAKGSTHLGGRTDFGFGLGGISEELFTGIFRSKELVSQHLAIANSVIPPQPNRDFDKHLHEYKYHDQN